MGLLGPRKRRERSREERGLLQPCTGMRESSSHVRPRGSEGLPPPKPAGAGGGGRELADKVRNWLLCDEWWGTLICPLVW